MAKGMGKGEGRSKAGGCETPGQAHRMSRRMVCITMRTCMGLIPVWARAFTGPRSVCQGGGSGKMHKCSRSV